ncbi:replication protein A 70 kDa DNA-binding subunit D-like [Forsythia ovata]|uniref:Replication protein A 70 kDa DNA-binding subunit D-like n=1 Tax=Forsythia ovata TaxID=205694 RepID=A0ABD1P7I4_9LAMI
MSKEFQLISNVSPGSSGWTVKVVVAEKFSPRIAQKSPTKYQNLILMDTEGSTVQATLYGQNITAFQDQLTLENTYLVSNAMVKITNPEYKAKSREVQWIISGRTRIRKLSSKLCIPIDEKDFTEIKNIQGVKTVPTPDE